MIATPLQEISMTKIIETRIIGVRTKSRLSAALAAVAIFSAIFAMTAVPGSANANDRDRGGHRDWHRGGGGWNRGYYGAPPVVYGTPYYAPPVVYGPGFGINLNIR
jgi:hypothetical protein